jgi:hypothetical protein
VGPVDRPRGGVRQTPPRAFRRVHTDALAAHEVHQATPADPRRLRSRDQGRGPSARTRSRCGCDVLRGRVRRADPRRDVRRRAAPRGTDQQRDLYRHRAARAAVRDLAVPGDRDRPDGISGIISPDGTVVASARERIRKVLDERVALADGLTPGIRFGGQLKAGLSVLGLLATAWAYLVRRRSDGKMAP